MTSWRPVVGTITRLDPDLTSESDIQKLFADERIFGRGQTSADNPAQFEFELAIAGRKRRVATLDEEKEIFKGRSLQNLAEYLHETLHAVEVKIPGTILHGPMDLGAVDIDDSDIESGFAGDSCGDEDSADMCESISRARVYTDNTLSGSGFALADIPLSDVPMLATSQHQEIGTVKFNGLRLLISGNMADMPGKLASSSDFSLSFSMGEHDPRPALCVTRMGQTLRWDWSGQRTPFAWSENEPVARDFVRDELGAGGVARAAVADMIDATFEDVRVALLTPADKAPQALIAALHLPEEVYEYLVNDADMRIVPGIHICEPHGAAGAFSQRLAYECAGYGHINPTLANAWRATYLQRPWLTSLVSAAQVGVGSVVLATGMRKKADGKRSLWKVVAGSLLITSAFSRILTTQYVHSAMERFVGNLDE